MLSCKVYSVNCKQSNLSTTLTRQLTGVSCKVLSVNSKQSNWQTALKRQLTGVNVSCKLQAVW